MDLAKQYRLEMKAAITVLLNTLKKNPEIWNIRKEAAHMLFDNTRYDEAADLIWSAPEIPAVDLEIAFAARVLSRAQPKHSIRLLKHVITQTRNNPAKLLAIANALMHYGMVMQAARFYGAATALDVNFSNGELEHFMLWLDDSHRLWGDWEKDGQQMEELPWVKREDLKANEEKKMMSGLTTPIKVPGINELTSEHMINEYYRQSMIKDGEITAPPAVTVPLDQLNPDDVIQDSVLGAPITPKKSVREPIRVYEPGPQAMTAETMRPKASSPDVTRHLPRPPAQPALNTSNSKAHETPESDEMKTITKLVPQDSGQEEIPLATAVGAEVQPAQSRAQLTVKLPEATKLLTPASSPTTPTLIVEEAAKKPKLLF